MANENPNVRTAIDIGLSEDERLKISQGLSGLLADSYTLYLMTQTSTGT